MVQKSGSEFLVNTQTASGRYVPSITGLSDGSFVVTWQDFSGTLGDDDASSIKGQIFSATGDKIGSEFLVNTEIAGVQALPTITGLVNGGFVVSWYDFGGTLGDSSGTSIKAQVFSATGDKVGSEFLVNTQTASDQYLPTVTGLTNGGFVVSWLDISGALGDGDGASIKAQVFTATGDKVGSEFLVNTQATSGRYVPTITGLTNGGFVVSWQDLSGTLGDSSGTSIKAQVFNAAGDKVGSEFLVNTHTSNDQSLPTITGLSNGNFVVSWFDLSGTLGDSSGTSIKAQIFNASGTKIGSEFRVNTETNLSQISPTITSLANGGFVVSWHDFSGTLGDSAGASIKAQVFSATGARIGSEFLVNTQTTDDQLTPAVTGLANGDFVITWYDNNVTQGIRGSIKAQIFEVVEPNAAPVAEDQAKSAAEDTLISGQVIATDLDGDALTYALVQGARDANGNPVAGLTFGADGQYSFQGPQDFNGTVTFTYTASDGSGTSAPAEVTLTITPVNDAPKAETITANGASGTAIAVTLQGTDVEGALQGFVLAKLPAGGTLYLDAGLTQPVATNTLYAPQDGGRLTLYFLAASNFTGTVDFDYTASDGSLSSPAANVSITVMPPGQVIVGTAASERLVGMAGNDRISGEAGNDTLLGGGGSDTLVGGLGMDSLDGGEGVDTLDLSGATGPVAVNLSKTVLQNIGADQGRDLVLNIENVIGSAFNDSFAGSNLANLLQGRGGNDRLFGFGGADTLEGGDGNDLLDGGVGADSLFGGAGDDTYVVDNAGDVVSEAVSPGVDAGGLDTVKASISFVLGEFFENLTLIGAADLTGTGNALGNRIAGNNGANLIQGLDGNDTLLGGRGADTLEGGAGDDVFLYLDLGDRLDGGSGTDTLDMSRMVSRSWIYLDGTDEKGVAQSNAFAATGTVLVSVENIVGSKGFD
ncbi:Ig-like domain-containing protein, partial [Pararoseomonas baculiformis]|uniref:Ig-like domain-containing protein n=1 Tax=Pararoseomonas baculiformis TaxID=2820812 RepID=UPI0031595CE1